MKLMCCIDEQSNGLDFLKIKQQGGFMEWHFKCPLCNSRSYTDWERRGKISPCGNCEKDRKVPAPSEQPEAYVDQHGWPDDMEKEVFRLKGKDCAIEGCKDSEITLDHIKAYSKGGKTSVSNLQPMCKSHNSSKNDTDFSAWLKENNLKKRQSL